MNEDECLEQGPALKSVQATLSHRALACHVISRMFTNVNDAHQCLACGTIKVLMPTVIISIGAHSQHIVIVG